MANKLGPGPPTIVIVAHRPEAFAWCGRLIRLSQQHPPRIEERDETTDPICEVPA